MYAEIVILNSLKVTITVKEGGKLHEIAAYWQ